MSYPVYPTPLFFSRRCEETAHQTQGLGLSDLIGDLPVLCRTYNPWHKPVSCADARQYTHNNKDDDSPVKEDQTHVPPVGTKHTSCPRTLVHGQRDDALASHIPSPYYLVHVSRARSPIRYIEPMGRNVMDWDSKQVVYHADPRLPERHLDGTVSFGSHVRAVYFKVCSRETLIASSLLGTLRPSDTMTHKRIDGITHPCIRSFVFELMPFIRWHALVHPGVPVWATTYSEGGVYAVDKSVHLSSASSLRQIHSLSTAGAHEVVTLASVRQDGCVLRPRVKLYVVPTTVSGFDNGYRGCLDGHVL